MRPTSWLQSLMSGLTSKPDPPTRLTEWVCGCNRMVRISQLPLGETQCSGCGQVFLRTLDDGPIAKLTHVECVEAEYLQHVTWWDLHSEGRSQREQENVRTALELWRRERLLIARELDQQDAEEAAGR